MIKETQKGLTCCSEVHLRKSGLALAIYNKIGAITKGGANGATYFASLEALADLFSTTANPVWRALTWLTNLGFLEKIDETEGNEHLLRALIFQSKHYRYVSHEEWSSNPENAKLCYQPLAMPWDGLGEDKLAPLLWQTSKGNTRWFAGNLACLRKAWPDDSRIVREWEQFLSGLEKPCVYRGQWKAAKGKFLKAAKQLHQGKASADIPVAV